MTDDHKRALAEGRDLRRKVKGYLDALEATRPKRGRKRTEESVKRRLGIIDDSINNADPVSRLEMIQERMDLHAELEQMSEKVDIAPLEAGFVEAAASYSERKGISYAAWRELGVDASVLKKAGVGRGR